MVKITAIILAAGLSRRMGQPKMLLPWGKTTVLGQVVRTLTVAIMDSGADWDTEKRIMAHKAEERRGGLEILVITGGARELVEAEVARLAAEGLPVQAVFNPQHEAGEMMSSVRVGLAASGPEAEFALIALGDQPQLSPQSARGVVSAANQAGARLVLPSYQMRRGHPWLVHRDLWLDLMTAETGRAFLRTNETGIFYVEADETVLKDLDTPEDYRADLQSH
jgi:molybdenum cofactor cytidylyltransferase